ncbi:DUF58 domain-containing protein [Methylophaga sp.]|uniref:DUF58 domain-containing protein n=1 Tax=Methylophaga sp. TaxID=2024840 RepID=UPI003F696ADE
MVTQLWRRWRTVEGQRIYIIPTRFGYGYVALLILMLLGAINYNNSLGHLLCFLLASLGHVAMHHSHRNIRLLSVTITALDPVFCHQPAFFRLTVNNTDTEDSYQIDVAHKSRFDLPRWQFMKAYALLNKIGCVEADSNHSCVLSIPTSKRGWQRLTKIRLSSLYPLGLFYSWTVYDNQADVLVYPKASGHRPLPMFAMQGNQSIKQALQGDDDFAGLRTYRSGDPLHRVAWKAFARDEVMRSKQFSRPRGQKLALRWEDLEDLSDTEARLSQLTSWVLQADSQGYQYGLELPDVSIAAGHGPDHQHTCLKALALYHG